MIIANGIILDDEKVFSALRSAALIPDDDDENGNIVIATEIPEGLLCSSVDGDVGYPGIYVDLVDASKVTPKRRCTQGVILSVTERPDPTKGSFIDEDDTAIRTRIYADFSLEDYTHQELYTNVELAFVEE